MEFTALLTILPLFRLASFHNPQTMSVNGRTIAMIGHGRRSTGKKRPWTVFIIHGRPSMVSISSGPLPSVRSLRARVLPSI
jgi:hypothetical protein